MAEEYNVPQGSLVVLAVTPHNENVPWYEYQWILCVSCQKTNQVSFPYSFPIFNCADSVQDINKESKHFISVCMDSEYWQVVAE